MLGSLRELSALDGSMISRYASCVFVCVEI